MARGDARGTLCRRCTPSPLARYPFSPLTFNTFPGERAGARARAPRPCQSQASAPQILQNTDINRLITRMALGIDIYNARESTRRARAARGGGTRVTAAGESAGKGKRKRVWVRWKFGDMPGSPTTTLMLLLRSAHSRHGPAGASRRSANVSDDVADIANCKNYHRETSPAASTPDFLNCVKARMFSPAFSFSPPPSASPPPLYLPSLLSRALSLSNSIPSWQ